MRILHGYGGGIFVRGSDHQHYRFYIGTDSSYNLFDRDNINLSSGDSPAIHTQPGQNNVLTFVAQGATLMAYINGQIATRIRSNDAADFCGNIGMMILSGEEPTEVAYNNIQLWQL